jgi:HEAT repeat protein
MEAASAVGPLTQVTADRGEPDELRGHAAVALGQVGRDGPEVVRAVTLALAERGSEVLRRQAALALSLLGAPSASSQLLRELRSGSTEHLLAQVAVAFGRLDDLAAVEPLLKVAGDAARSELTQALAVVSLGLLVDPERRPSLHRLGADAAYPARTDALHEVLSIL